VAEDGEEAMFYLHGKGKFLGSPRPDIIIRICSVPLFLTYFSVTLNAENFHIDYYKINARVSLEA
jgi:hypothetical protein